MLRYSIIPFNKNHQTSINDLMTEIQKEFDTIFTSPNSKSISDLAGQGNAFWVALNDNKVIGTIGLTPFDNKQDWNIKANVRSKKISWQTIKRCKKSFRQSAYRSKKPWVHGHLLRDNGTI